MLLQKTSIVLVFAALTTIGECFCSGTPRDDVLAESRVEAATTAKTPRRRRPSSTVDTVQTADFFVLRGYMRPGSKNSAESLRNASRQFQLDYNLDLTDRQLDSFVQKEISRMVINYLKSFNFLTSNPYKFQDVRKAIKNLQKSTGGELEVTGTLNKDTLKFVFQNQAGYGNSDDLVAPDEPSANPSPPK